VLELEPDLEVKRAERLVARNFLALGTGELFARLVAFAATIYLARTLGAEYYGMIGFATAVVLYLSRLADAGMDLGVGVNVVAADPARLSKVAPTLLTIRVLVAALLSGALAVVGLTVFPQPDGAVLALYGLTLLAVGASSRWIYLGLEQASRVAAVRTGGELLMALLVFFLVRGPADIGRAPLAQFAGDALAALLLLGELLRRGYRLRPRLDSAVVRGILPRAAPMVAASILGLMIYNSDLVFLRFMEGTASVGYYAAAYTLVSFLSNIGIAYALSLLPTLTRLHGTRDQQQRLYHTAVAHVFAATLPVALGGTVLAGGIIALVFGGAYLDSGVALRVLVWAIPASVLRDIAIVALMAAGRERRILELTAGAAALNLVLNLLLIPRFSLTGAAVATVATEVVRMVAALVLARAEGLRTPGLHRFWKATLAGAAMTLVLLLLRPTALWVAISVSALVFALGLTLTGALRLRGGRICVSL